MLVVPSHYTAVTDFMADYKKGSAIEIYSESDLERLVNLRCSQLPLCPTSLLLNYKRKGMVRSMDMFGGFYTSVGTAVHTVMQTYLPQTGNFLADYYCTKCHRYYPMSHTFQCCGVPTHYEEVLIDYKGIVGHIDAIYRDRKGRYWIVDFKTTSLAQAPKKKTNPGEGYVAQIESYAYLLYRQYGIRVSGVMLCFIPRDNPRIPTMWVQTVDKLRMRAIHARLKEERVKHKMVMAAETVKDALAIAKHKCNSPYCEYCKKPDSEIRAWIKRIMKTEHHLPMGELREKLVPKPKATITYTRTGHIPVSARFAVDPTGIMGAAEFNTAQRQLKKSIAKVNKIMDEMEATCQ